MITLEATDLPSHKQVYGITYVFVSPFIYLMKLCNLNLYLYLNNAILYKTKNKYEFITLFVHKISVKSSIFLRYIRGT